MIKKILFEWFKNIYMFFHLFHCLYLMFNIVIEESANNNNLKIKLNINIILINETKKW